MWAALTDLPLLEPSTSTDDSWALALGHFLKHHVQAGEDYFFTYGPLGYFLTWTSDRDLFWCRLAWEVLVKSLFVFALLKLIKPLGLPARLTACLVIVAFAGPILTMPDVFCMVILMAQVVLLMNAAENPSRIADLVGVSLMGLLALTKFTLCLYSMTGVVGISGYLIRNRRWGRALLLVSGFAASFGIYWLAAGQHLANLPRYFYGSLQVTSGYTEAMALDGDPTQLYLGVAIALLLAASLIAFPLRCHWKLKQATLAVLIGLAIFQEWKNGFVRHDQHSFGFFAFVLFLPFLLPVAFPTIPWRKPPRVVLLACALFLSAAGIEIVLRDHGFPYAFNPAQLLAGACAKTYDHVTNLLHPVQRWRASQEEYTRVAAAHALPRIRAVVQDRTVDILSQEQSLILFNHLNWRPRPVFQSYCAYTPYLISANAQFLAGARAPEFLIVNLRPVDGRLPALEDGAALLQILHDYQPVLIEKTYLLMKRNSEGAPRRALSRHVSRDEVVKFDQEVSLDGEGDGPQVLALDVKCCKTGKLRNFLHKPPPLFIRLRMANGQVHRFRFIPAMARTGFLINPLVSTNLDVTRLYGPAAGQRVVSFCIHTGDNAPRCYQAEFQMTLARVPELVGHPVPVAELNRLQYPSFANYPTEVDSDRFVQVQECQGKDVLLVHPDGRLTFSLPPGAHELKGEFGIMPIAYERGDTDGVQFVVEHQPDQGPSQVLFQRYLDPLHQTGDRGTQALTVPLPAPGGGRVLLKTVNLPGKTVDWDWSYWGGIQIH
jgi:hypothetical protein